MHTIFTHAELTAEIDRQIHGKRLGRPRGVKEKNPRRISSPLFSKMEPLEVGECCWIESANIKQTMTAATTYTRMAQKLQGRRFACEAFTAVSAKETGKICVLVRIERTE